jgi:hypothetical protein
LRTGTSEVSAEDVEVPAGASDVDENDELRAAILRTTQHMTAEGIIPPESVGLAAAESEVSAPEEAVTPDAAEDATPKASVEAEPAAAFWPWDTSADAGEPDAAVAPEVAGVYDALQEPSDELPEPDIEAVLRRPVMMGSYDQETDASAAPAVAGTHAPMSQVDDAPSTAIGERADEDSDFILDLDSVEPAVIEGAEATESEPESENPAEPSMDESAQPVTTVPDEIPAVQEPASVVSPLEGYTCEDCVYVATCPNRDQRLPKDCGSFQWK